jgi:hypothetical protein
VEERVEWIITGGEGFVESHDVAEGYCRVRFDNGISMPIPYSELRVIEIEVAVG